MITGRALDGCIGTLGNKPIKKDIELMGNWQSRDMKLRQRHVNKEFSRPFRKKQEKNKRDKQQRIREAQKAQAKYVSLDEDDDTSYE